VTAIKGRYQKIIAYVVIIGRAARTADFSQIIAELTGSPAIAALRI
jgi:hypothetical protein